MPVCRVSRVEHSKTYKLLTTDPSLRLLAHFHNRYIIGADRRGCGLEYPTIRWVQFPRQNDRPHRTNPKTIGSISSSINFHLFTNQAGASIIYVEGDGEEGAVLHGGLAAVLCWLIGHIWSVVEFCSGNPSGDGRNGTTMVRFFGLRGKGDLFRVCYQTFC